MIKIKKSPSADQLVWVCSGDIVDVHAYISLNKDKNISCLIDTVGTKKGKIEYVMDTDDIINILFKGNGKPLATRCWYFDDKTRKDKFIQLPKIRIFTTEEEANEFAQIVDEMYLEWASVNP